MKAYVVSLGCPKNLTDSEVLMGNLTRLGHEITLKPSEAEMIVVNTCAFLRSAREEARQVLNEMSRYRKKGKCKQLFAAGCLPVYLKKTNSTMRLPKIDNFVDTIGLYTCNSPRIKATDPWFAYVKIAEGCDNHCSYCLIPMIRGRFKTRRVNDILKEVKGLAGRGVKEIIYVAQDTTAHPRFVELLKKTALIKGIEWIRIMYTHPNHITDALINVIAKEKKIVKYIDMPIQHISNKILKTMNRHYTRNDIEKLISKLRNRVPGIAIRTSVIAGFPGEGENEFNELLDFVKKAKFDRLGVLPYSREEGTGACAMEGHVPEKIKLQRLKKLMELQARISKEINRKFIGKKLEVLIEAKQNDKYVGRTYRDAPEIDGKVNIKSKKNFHEGELVGLRVRSASPYDLSA